MSEAQNRIRTFLEFRRLKIIMLVIQTAPGHNAVPFTFLTTADNPLSLNVFCFNNSCYGLFKDTSNSNSCTTINNQISEYWTIRDMQGSSCHLIWNTVRAFILWDLGGGIRPVSVPAPKRKPQAREFGLTCSVTLINNTVLSVKISID